MSKDQISQKQDELKKELEEDLLRIHGPLLTAEALWKLLGYQSRSAFKQAVSRNHVPVPLFDIEHRRGKFALAKDLAAFLAEKRCKS